MDYAVVWQHVMSSPWWCVCCVMCGVTLHSTQHTHHHGLDITYCHTNHTVHNDVLLLIILINLTLARLICELPDVGRRPKHVAAILM